MARYGIDEVAQLLVHVAGSVRELRAELAALALAPTEKLYFTRILNAIESSAASLSESVLYSEHEH